MVETDAQTGRIGLFCLSGWLDRRVLHILCVMDVVVLFQVVRNLKLDLWCYSITIIVDFVMGGKGLYQYRLTHGNVGRQEESSTKDGNYKVVWAGGSGGGVL